LLLGLMGCTADKAVGGEADSGPVWGDDYCQWILDDQAPVTDAAGLGDALDIVRAALYPELAVNLVTLDPTDSPEDYFVMSVDLGEGSGSGDERAFLLRYSTVQFADPMPYSGLGAILVHELKHAVDFRDMSSQQLVDFALWYSEGDYASYERETDEAVLEAGCGQGLIDFRLWLYDHVDAETLLEKQRDYYTPEEIAAWMEANP
jgi:hypothetical protein